jgi:Uma2 family endonuclease
MTDKTFYEFCQRNKDFRFEMDKRGNLIIMPPTFLETTCKNIEINFQLVTWTKKNKTGLLLNPTECLLCQTAQSARPTLFGF